MRDAKQPTAQERLALKHLRRQAMGWGGRRAHLILLSAQRHPGPELALLFAMSRATVRLWSRRFNAHGPVGLYDVPRSGRPPQVHPQVQETLVPMRQDEPRHAGDRAPCWAAAMLGLALAHTVAVRRSASALRVARYEWGRRGGRPRVALPTQVDAEKARQPVVMAKAGMEAGAEATMPDGDVSRLPRLPRRRTMWPCTCALDGGYLWSASGGARTIASPCGTACWSPIPKAPSCTPWIMSVAIRPTPSVPGWPPTPVCTCTMCPRMVHM